MTHRRDVRRDCVSVTVDGVTIGGQAPIAVQSMTNTLTADIDHTVTQVQALADAGSDLVRITVDTEEAASAVGIIRRNLDANGYMRYHQELVLERGKSHRSVTICVICS